MPQYKQMQSTACTYKTGGHTLRKMSATPAYTLHKTKIPKQVEEKKHDHITKKRLPRCSYNALIYVQCTGIRKFCLGLGFAFQLIESFASKLCECIIVITNIFINI